MEPSAYLDLMPKAELHLHMEGAIQPETVLLLAEQNKIPLPFSTPEQFKTFLNYRDFADFVKVFMMVVDCLRKPEDFSLVIDRLGAEMARQNIRYAEITWTPQVYLRLNLPLPIILEALNEGRKQARQNWGVEMRWIPDLVRSVPGSMRQVQQWLCSDDALNGGVVALGLGGPERGFPASAFSEIFSAARGRGLASNPHAGEAAGPESVWEAIRELRAQRLGHGVRSIEDKELMAYLAEHNITLEVCPTSNVKLGIYPDYAAHPLKNLIVAGCPVTINSDDPVLFGTSLTEEYRHAVFDCGLSLKEIERAVLTALNASYLETAEKKCMIKMFMNEFSQLTGGCYVKGSNEASGGYPP